MHILFLSHYFPPEVNAPATRTYEHCRHWVESGHKVTVVTCVPNHPQGKIYPGFKNRLFQKDIVDGIEVIRLWTYITANEGFFKRTLNYVLYMFAVILALPFLPKAKIVVSTSPQFFCGLAGFFYSFFKRARWVLEIRDLWPESIIAVGAINNKAIIKSLEWIESFAYRRCHKIVCVTDAFKKFICGKGITPEKVEVIKNGVDLQLFSEFTGENELAEEHQLSNKFVASYVGTHGMAHHLETVLQAAELLHYRDDIVFLLVGDGAERNRLLAMKDEMKLENVLMLGQMPKSRMPEIWDLSDASLVLLKKSDLFKTVIPSKIFESMAMRKPIILGVEGEVKDIIDDAGCGICIEPENAEQLAKALKQLADDSALHTQKGDRGKVFVEQNFDRKVLAQRYAEILNAL
ncbi:MAG: glycosyltransferase WbuB [Gammaproteobacteria bacterium]|nr:MAG: glycosyltransferase WbuB [Gammaproteobacteria bacterium]